MSTIKPSLSPNYLPKPTPPISSTTPSINTFLTQNNLPPTSLQELHHFFHTTHPKEPYTLLPTQGFCSLTFSLSSNQIIQFRPANYALDLTTTSLASRIYPRYAPITRYITELPRTGLLVYEMNIVSGLSLKDHRLLNRELAISTSFLRKLIVSFASFQRESWGTSTRILTPPPGYKDTKVASSLKNRLLELDKHLPDRFRPVTTRLLENFEAITDLPWVFTHGDLLPGNIMVDAKEGCLTGFVDWGESEYLPYGMGFYGVDEILLLPCGDSDSDEHNVRFQFHPKSGELRKLFWEVLERGSLGVPTGLRGEVEMARELGVLLWFGIAWDGGRIDRVVEEERDLEEVGKLDAFLFGCGGGGEGVKGEVEVEVEGDAVGVRELLSDNGKENLRGPGIVVEAKLYCKEVWLDMVD